MKINKHDLFLTFLGGVVVLPIFIFYGFEYYPGNEDISLYSQNSIYSIYDWFFTGYQDWFDTQPDLHDFKMYEIRPLTHIYMAFIIGIFGDNYSLYPIAMIATSLFLSFSIIYMANTFRLTYPEKLVLILAFWMANPCLSFEVFKDLAFIQVMLGVSFFCLIISFSYKNNMPLLLFILVLSALLKESTLCFGILASAIILMKGLGKNKAIVAFFVFYIVFFGIRFSFDELSLVSALDISNMDINNHSFIVSAVSYLGTMGSLMLGQNDIDKTEVGLLISLMGLLILMLLLSEFKKSKRSDISIVIASLIITLLLFSCYSHEMRWGWEFSVSYLMSSILIWRNKGRLKRLGLIVIVAPWFITGLMNYHTILFTYSQQIESVSFDRYIYEPFNRLMKDVSKKGITKIYVLNDQTRIKQEYINLFAKTDLKIVRLTEGKVLKRIGFEDLEFKVNSKEFKFSLLRKVSDTQFDFKNIKEFKPLFKSINDMNYDFEFLKDKVRISSSSKFNPLTDGIVVYDNEDRSYNLYTIENDAIRIKVYSGNMRTMRGDLFAIDSSCGNIDGAYFNNNEHTIGLMKKEGMKHHGFRFDYYEKGCLLTINKDFIAKYEVTGIYPTDSDNNTLDKIERRKPHVYEN